MELKRLYFICLLLSALSMAPSMAHLLEFPAKMHLGADQYLVVQQLYRGWSLLGIVWIAALAADLALTIATRRQRPLFYLNGTAFLCMLASLAIFFAVTFPANRATDNWTILPAGWRLLRLQWEYSHAVNAVLNLIAFILLLVSALKRSK